MTRNHRKSKSLILPFGIGAAALLAGVIFLMGACTDKGSRQYLDKFVESINTEVSKVKSLQPGVSVYVDFSNGMNSAYGTPLSQDALKNVINVFTGAKDQAAFFSLANDTITPLNLPQTGIYNAILSPGNYTKTMAPIEKSLAQIVEKRQGALLITDFEEYNGGVIQRQNYAKDYFIDWLSKGYDITFYKLDYKEGALPKHLYFTVFDAPSGELAKMVENAIGKYVGQGIEKFVLGGTCFQLYGADSYPSSIQGGNYHSNNGKGEDIVTAVIEKGDEESFIKYTMSPFLPYTEYYPLGVAWKDLPANIAATQEEGMPKEDVYTHFLSKMYVDFSKQNGYDIQEVAARVVNFEPSIQRIMIVADSLAVAGEEFKIPSDLPQQKPVLDMFTASIEPAQIAHLPGHDWKEIFVDLDQRFKGTLPAGMDSEKDMLEID
ncbi:MAG: hypothetical protein K2J48_03480, partial [Muribaculaceae bacterium]|nr:hypothetical protein [Muribaculaceae bacterium]